MTLLSKKTCLPSIDFLSPQMTYRRKHASLKREALARALGLTAKKPVYIVDATAGLARDSFIIAALGFEIHLIERSPTIHALLVQAMQQAAEQTDTASIIQRMHLIHADAITWLQHPPPSPDIIYLDPMFPLRSKSALPKKEMRIFQEIVGNDTDAETLFATALACAVQRVVVKRPRLAAPLGQKPPSFSLTGSSCRFDVYLSVTRKNGS